MLRRVRGALIVGMVVWLVVSLSAARSAAESSFTPIGFLPGGFGSAARAVSADGSVVAGWSNDDTTSRPQPIIWTRDAGMLSLGFLGTAEDVSPDGAFVTGATGSRPFLWSAEGGTTFLDVPGGAVGFGVAAGGSAVVGGQPSSIAFMWLPSTGVVLLPAHSDFSSQAFAVTPDATVVVGEADRLVESRPEATIWFSPTAKLGLGFLPGHARSTAYAVSHDGAVVVGTSDSGSGGGSFRAFRWTEETGMIDLGALCILCGSVAYAVSADGSVIVGSSGGLPFIWDEINGLRNLWVVLEENDVDLTGWRSGLARDVSADGRVVVGEGLFVNRQQGWIATLPPPNSPPDCSETFADPGDLWPPNRAISRISIGGLTDPDGDMVTVLIDSIRQDEPLGYGRGAAGGLQTDTAQVPAERDGRGDGRVYHIGFTASDEFGGECSGAATVCVPHDQGRDATCVDGGPLFDSVSGEWSERRGRGRAPGDRQGAAARDPSEVAARLTPGPARGGRQPQPGGISTRDRPAGTGADARIEESGR